MVFNPTSAQEKVRVAPLEGYLSDLRTLNLVKPVKSGRGFKRFVSEQTFQMVDDLPEFEGATDGVWKDSFEGDDGTVFYMVYFMKTASPEVVVNVAKTIGLPNPFEARDKVDSISGMFPDY